VESGDVRYLIAGRETAASGTPHLQGYVEFKKPKRLNAVKSILGGQSIHLEVARGNRDQAIDYCKKEDPSPFEYGDRGAGGQGKRSDLAAVVDLVKSGKTLRDVCEEHGESFIKYSRGIRELVNICAEPRDFPTNFIWRYGKTGAGKSRASHEESKGLCNGDVAWISDVSLKWFDGIDANTRGIVLDEFDGTASLAYLLRLLDRYPLKVPIKGGMVNFRCRWVFITSQFSPSRYYGQHDQWKALVRRIRDYGQVIEYNTEGDGIHEIPKEDWEFILNE